MVRTKVEIKKIEDKAKRHTTFTKRRNGLIKKAEELCNRCNAEVVVISFSLAGNLFAWGHPGANNVVYRYLKHIGEEEEEENKDEENRDHDGLELGNHANNVVYGFLENKQQRDSLDAESGALLWNVGEDPENHEDLRLESDAEDYPQRSLLYKVGEVKDLREIERILAELEQLKGEMEEKKREIIENMNQMRLET